MTGIVEDFQALLGGGQSGNPVQDFRQLLGPQTRPQPRPDRQTTAEQRAASRTVERVAPIVEDVNRSVASGLMEGSEGLASIPSMPGRLMDAAVIKGAGLLYGLAGREPPEWVQGLDEYNQANAAPASELMRSGGVVQDVLDYEPQTTLGDYAETAASYVPGAILFGGGGEAAAQTGRQATAQAMRTAGENVLRYGVIPGAAEEGAGRAAEVVFGPDSTAEAIARPVAALGAGVLAARPTGQVRPLGARETDIRHAETLRASGIEPTVGQVTRNPALRAMEGTRGQVDDQLQQVTRVALRSIGVNGDEITPAVLRQSYDDIVGVMDDAVSEASFRPGNRFVSDAAEIAEEYRNMTPTGNQIKGVDDIVEQFRTAAQQGADVPLSTIRRWRTTLGQMMSSNQPETVLAAGRLRGLIDDATTDTLRRLGRNNDVEALTQARRQFRNWLAVMDASTRPGAAGGLLSPQALRQAIIRTQGRRNVATGRTTDLGDVSQATDALLRPMPTVREGGVRTLPEALTGAGVGALLGNQIAGAPGMAVGFAAGSQLPRVSEAVMRSNALQNLMMDPRGQFANAILGTSSGLASQP